MPSDIIIDTISRFMPTTSQAWEVRGILNHEDRILPFGNDSKIIGRIFEIIIEPILKKAAEELNYEFGAAEQQTIYPDFWFKNPDNKRLIGIDIKSTYRKIMSNGTLAPFNFTLGAYSSFLRNGTKNIHGNYADYDAHYVIGFLYSRTVKPTDTITELANSSNIVCPYSNVEYFIQEKYKIGGQSKGSGNTNNISTFKSNNIEDFRSGYSYFTSLGKEAFENYWKSYPLYQDSKETKESLYHNLETYFQWLNQNGQIEYARELQLRYNDWKSNIGASHSIT